MAMQDSAPATTTGMHAYRLIPPCLVDLNLAVLILRGHQRILYSLVILGLLSAKNLG